MFKLLNLPMHIWYMKYDWWICHILWYEIHLTCMLIKLYNNNNIIDWFMLLLTAHTNQIQSESLGHYYWWIEILMEIPCDCKFKCPQEWQIFDANKLKSQPVVVNFRLHISTFARHTTWLYYKCISRQDVLFGVSAHTWS